MVMPCTLLEYEAALTTLRHAPGVCIFPHGDEERANVSTPKLDFFLAFNGTQLALVITEIKRPYRGLGPDVLYAYVQDLLGMS